MAPSLYISLIILCTLASPMSFAAGIVTEVKMVKGLSGGASLIESNKYLTFIKKEAGVAKYSVSVSSAGTYKMKVKVIARKETENSVYFSIDSQSKVVFDFAISSTVKENIYPGTFTLSSGAHIIIFSGKEPYIKMASFELIQVDTAPSPSPSASPSPSPSPSSSPTPVPQAGLLSPAPSQFGIVNSFPIIAASSVVDAVTKLKSAAAGTRIQLPSGTFSNVAVTFEGKGISGKPVILEGQANGSTIINGKVKIVVKGTQVLLRQLSFVDADSPDYGGGSSLIKFDACSYCGIHRSSFSGGPAAVMSSGTDAKHFKTIMISAAATSVEVAYNSFRGKRNGGSVVLVNRSTTRTDFRENHRIYRNLFSDRQIAGDDANDFDVIRVGDSATSQSPSPTAAEALLDQGAMVSNIVEFNLFQNVGLESSLAASCKSSNSYNLTKCKGEPEVISVKAPQTMVRFNTFLNINGGLTLRHGFQAIVEANYFAGTNANQGIAAIAPNSYGIRVIGENHLVMNNHIQDVATSSTLLAGISILPGQPNAALNGYWPVHDSVIALNYLKNVTDKVISLATDYGNREKTILPEKMFIGYNVLSGNIAPIQNQASSSSYLSTISFQQNTSDGPALTGALAAAVIQASPIATGSLSSGIVIPTNSSYVGSSGVLAQSSIKQQEILYQLGQVASTQSVARMKKLMQFLKIKSGTLYENFKPLKESDVGPLAP